jgi:hypothetical protein
VGEPHLRAAAVVIHSLFITPVWQQSSGSAHAIAAAITPILHTLVASGAVPFPAHAFTFAAAALLLSERRSRATSRGKSERFDRTETS